MIELDRSSISIRFIGKDLHPTEIGKQLGFIESGTVKSTVRNNKKGLIVWSIALEAIEIAPIVYKIKILLSHFTNDIHLWQAATSKVKAEIFCGLFLESWNQGFSLSTDILNELSSKNLNIGFDIYAPTDSWDELSDQSNDESL